MTNVPFFFVFFSTIFFSSHKLFLSIFHLYIYIRTHTYTTFSPFYSFSMRTTGIDPQTSYTRPHGVSPPHRFWAFLTVVLHACDMSPRKSLRQVPLTTRRRRRVFSDLCATEILFFDSWPFELIRFFFGNVHPRTPYESPTIPFGCGTSNGWWWVGGGV